PTDIIQLFGTSSVPVVVAGTVLGVFELGERLASQRAKDALSKWLLTFDVQKAKALPDGTQELFERIFGDRHCRNHSRVCRENLLGNDSSGLHAKTKNCVFVPALVSKANWF